MGPKPFCANYHLSEVFFSLRYLDQMHTAISTNHNAQCGVQLTGAESVRHQAPLYLRSHKTTCNRF
jgi:hypothetical protein